MKNILFSLALFSLVTMSCDPDLDDKVALGEPPNSVSFEFTDIGENTFRFMNTTEGTFIHQWDFDNGLTDEGEEVEVQYSTAGTYNVTLTAFNDGGFATTTREIVVMESLGVPCPQGSVYELLTACTSKAWSLDDGPGTLFVGPNANETWYESSEDEPAARPCAWNDEWIFSADGTFEYDAKGDIWAEDYMGFEFECVDESALSEMFQPWTSGVFTFEYIPGSVDQIFVSGLGAYIGLPKVTNDAEVGAPVTANIYDIVEIYQDGDKTIMLLEISIGNGIWRFRLKSE